MARLDGIWRQRTGRRSLIRAGAVGGAGLTSAFLLGCGRSEEPAQNRSAQQQPKRGGTLTHAGGPAGTYDTRGVGFDPHSYAPVGGRSYRLFYQGLLAYDLRTYEAQPELGQKWEQPSRTETVFTLQPGVKFHNKPPANGRALTAEDVAFSLNRARGEDPIFQSRSLLSSVDRIEAIDKSTLRITLKRPDVVTLSNLSVDAFLVLAPEVVDAAGKFSTAESAVGTGPFILTSAQEGVSAEYVRNPDYWKPGLPYLDEIRSRHFEQDELAWAGFRAGAIDIARVPGTEVTNYIQQQGAGYTPDWFADDAGIAAMPNVKMAPLNDARVYTALRLLIDHDEFIHAWAESWMGSGRNASIFTAALSTWDFSHDEYYKFLAWKQPKDDAAREAVSLLNAAGFSRTNPVSIELSCNETPVFSSAMAQLLQGQWRRLGQGAVDAQIRAMDQATLNTVRARKQFNYIIVGVSGGTNDPDSFLSQIYRTGGSKNYGDFSDPKVDDMIDQQSVIFDNQQRKAAIRDIVSYMAEKSPYVYPTARLWLNGVRPTIRGFQPEYHMNGLQYESIWLDV